MSVLIILLALTLLITGAWAGASVLALAPLLAVVAAFLSGDPALASYTQVFMKGAGGFVVSFFPLFLLGAMFGRVMEMSGAADTLARAIAKLVGPQNAIPAVVIACAVLTYGGVSLFVVAFTAWPLARALFIETDLPARLIPATIALGAFTFTMTAFPGTPSIQNAIPMATFATTPFAAPGLGLIASGIMLVLWLQTRTARLAGEPPPARNGAPLGDGRAAPLACGPADRFRGADDAPDGSVHSAGSRYQLSGRPGLWRNGAGKGQGALVRHRGLELRTGSRLLVSPPANILATTGAGAESSLLPLFNTASLVGFGAVIAILPGFEVLRSAIDGWPAGMS